MKNLSKLYGGAKMVIRFDPTCGGYELLAVWGDWVSFDWLGVYETREKAREAWGS